ncbi:MAG: YybH family protein [Candidatus Glassbacteria bacterium]
MSIRSALFTTFTLAFACVACQQQAQQVGPLPEEDVAALKNMIEPYAQAMLQGDWAAVAAMYTEDAVRMPPNEPLHQGRAAIQSWLEARPITITDFSLGMEDVDGRDVIAWARGTYSITYTIGGEGEPATDSGKWLNVLRKQPDGSWLIAVNMWNSDKPIPQKKEPFVKEPAGEE